MIRCNVNLFRIANTCASKDPTRPYLSGVFMESHKGSGIILTATDGNKLISIHDKHGTADESAIVSWPLSGLKASRRETDRYVEVVAEWRVDGCFLDWRRVVPCKNVLASLCFDGENLAIIANIAAELERHFNCYNKNKGNAATSIIPSGDGLFDPALVLFPKVPAAFGVLMPIGYEPVETPPHLPR